ncbi:putative phage abortive infection protein [Mucilaginibacter pedocola]|nr:putative phage abortive infection protein [Mucilaginibacter pedocola]
MGKSQGFETVSGTIGDTYGGTLGPIIAFIAAILTFFAFWIQYQANLQQKKDLKVERFENKFFELLRLYKETVSEMSIDGYDISITSKKTFSRNSGEEILERTEEYVTKIITGRKVFVTNFYELKAFYEICEHELHLDIIKDKPRYLIKLSYILFFNGVGNPVVKNIDKTLPLDSAYVLRCKNALDIARQQHVQSRGQSNSYQLPGTERKVGILIKYKPFSGHSTKLGQYYRHLFYMVKYVVGQPNNVLKGYQKREYLRIVRAQLSSFEQLMLYFNYLSGYGNRWEDEENSFFAEFRMIHNMPLELTDFTIDPHVEFEKQIEKIRAKNEEMFEYDE